MKVSHSYATPGEHEVTLTVTSGGKSDDFRFLAESTDPRLLSLRLNNGNPDDVTAFDARVTQDGTRISQSGGVFTLTDKNYFTVDRNDTNHLHGLDEFLLSFDLKRGSTGSDTTGRIIGINKAWSISLDKSGSPTFDLTNSDGKTYKVVSSAAITDTAWHSVESALRRCGGQGDLLCRRQGRGQRRRLRSDAGLPLLGADGREPVRAKLRGQPAEHRHLRERRGCRRQLSPGRGGSARHPSPARSRRSAWTSG